MCVGFTQANNSVFWVDLILIQIHTHSDTHTACQRVHTARLQWLIVLSVNQDMHPSSDISVNWNWKLTSPNDQWRINHEAMEARASGPQFLGQKSSPHSDSVEIFEVVSGAEAGLHALLDIVT